MDEEKSGVTFSDVCRTIWSQKWLALILLVVITLAGTLGLKYGYSSLKSEYVSTFSININLSEDGMLNYPDNTRHNYRDLISLDNLNDIIETNEDFASVNVEQMRKRGDITISQNRGESGVTYTVRVKSGYFSSLDDASQFIHEIAGTPSREIYKWVNGLASDTGISFADKLGNEQKLEYLKSQLNEIEARFNNLGGISDAAKQKVNNLLLTATALTGELHTAYYEPSADALDNYVNLIEGLKSERDLAQSVLDNLKGLNISQPDAGASSGDTTIIINGTELVKYAEMVATLNQQINNYQLYIDRNPAGTEESAACKAFTAKLEKLLVDVQSLTANEECNYYKNTSLVSYEGAPVKEAGAYGFAKSGLISLVAGFIIAVIVAYITGWVINNKKKANADKVASAVNTANGTCEADADNGEVSAQTDGENK